MKKNILTMSTLIGVFLCSLVFMTSVHKSKQKLFWHDEGHEIVTICKRTLGQILTGHIDQRNKNPIYYLLQRINIMGVDTFDEGILVRYRFISILSAFIIALILYFFIRRKNTNKSIPN